MIIVAGVDVGSRTTKAVLLDANRAVLGRARARTRPDFDAVAQEILGLAARDAGAEPGDISYVATTGFGRYNISFRDTQVTDITAAARGAALLFPGTRTVLDVGAQNTRAVKVLEGGRVKEFRTNDKCAAGAGGFIERACRYLEVKLEEVGDLSLKGNEPQTISSVCAVLAESEIINHVTAGQSVENILRGVHDSLAGRARSLVKRVGLEPELTLVGGTVHQAGMVRAVSEAFGVPVNATEDCELAGALGAALLGLRRLEKLGQLAPSVAAA